MASLEIIRDNSTMNIKTSDQCREDPVSGVNLFNSAANHFLIHTTVDHPQMHLFILLPALGWIYPFRQLVGLLTSIPRAGS
jgi:hypothetical protein